MINLVSLLCRSLLVGTMLISLKAYSALPPDYDRDHPYYVKFCAGSQWNLKYKEDRAGVPAGHTTTYLKGACITQYKNELPYLHLCNENADFTQAETGVGISSDGGFKNTIFSAIPGYAATFTGGLDPSEIFDRDRQRTLIQDYSRRGYFDGIELHSEYLGNNARRYQDIASVIENPTSTVEQRNRAYDQRNQMVGKWIIGTEYVMSLARDLYCINIPVERELMGRVIKKLNDDNRALAGSKDTPWRGGLKTCDDYVWGSVHNNCNHTGHNLVAILGVLSSLGVDLSYYYHLANPSIPGRSLYEIFLKTLGAEDLDIEALYNDPQSRELIKLRLWPGADSEIFLEEMSMHGKNEVFENGRIYGNGEFPYLLLSRPNIARAYLFPSSRKEALESDARAIQLRAVMTDGRYAYLGEGPELRDHYESSEKRLSRQLNQVRRIKDTAEFLKKDKDYRIFIDSLEAILEDARSKAVTRLLKNSLEEHRLEEHRY